MSSCHWRRRCPGPRFCPRNLPWGWGWWRWTGSRGSVSRPSNTGSGILWLCSPAKQLLKLPPNHQYFWTRFDTIWYSSHDTEMGKSSSSVGDHVLYWLSSLVAFKVNANVSKCIYSMVFAYEYHWKYAFPIYHKKLFTEKNETLHKLILDIYIINKSQKNTHKVGILYISSKSEKKHSIPIPWGDQMYKEIKLKSNCLATDLRGGIYQSWLRCHMELFATLKSYFVNLDKRFNYEQGKSTRNVF